MFTWVIYKHTNKFNHKCYIGQTFLPTKIRWHLDGSGYLSKTKSGKYNQPKFARAILKYGWDNFTHEILEKGIKTLVEANARESFYITKYNSIKNGYNICSGGHNNIKTTSKAVLQLDYNKQIINYFSSTIEAARYLGVIDSSNIIACCKGRCNSYKNFYWCYANDYNNFIIKKAHSMPASCKRSIIQLSLDNNYINKFESINEAAVKTNSIQANISKCLAKQRNQTNGLKWLYMEEYYGQ